MRVEPTIDLGDLDLTSAPSATSVAAMKRFEPTVPRVLSLSGRISKGRFWLWWSLYGIILPAVALVASYHLLKDHPLVLVILGLFLGLFSQILLLSLFIRRLRDSGRSGWWVLLVFFPVLGGFFALAIGAIKSDKGRSLFGPPNVPLSRALNVVAFFLVVTVGVGLVLIDRVHSDEIVAAMMEVFQRL